MDRTGACWRPGSPNISGVDAPEIGKAKCNGEEFLGTQAKKRLQELLSLIVRIEEPGVKVLRVRSRVNAPTPAGEVLVREGYAGGEARQGDQLVASEGDGERATEPDL